MTSDARPHPPPARARRRCRARRRHAACANATSGSSSPGSGSATIPTRATSRPPARCSARAHARRCAMRPRALLELDLTRRPSRHRRAHARASSDRPTCSRRRATPRQIADLMPGARARGDAARRAHAHVRAHRRARPTRDRLRPPMPRRGARAAIGRRGRNVGLITDVPGVRAGHWTGVGHRRDRRRVPRRAPSDRPRSAGARPPRGRPRCSSPAAPSSRSTRSCSPAGRRSASPRPTA